MVRKIAISVGRRSGKLASLRKTVKRNLKKYGFDGLQNINSNCTCLIENLISCNFNKYIFNCIPWYNTKKVKEKDDGH